MDKSPLAHSPAFKAQVALAAMKGDNTRSEIAAQHRVKLGQAWNKQMTTKIIAGQKGSS